MENPGKFRISYIDRKSGEPMGDTENFETMEAAIRDAMGQGYLTLGRFEPQNFAMGGGVGSLSREARDMFRGPRGIATLPRFAEGGFVSKQVENYVSPTVQGRLDEDIARLQGRIEEIESSEFFNRSKSLKQQGQRLISHLRDQIAGYEARKHTSNEVINQVVDSETGEVVGESLTSLAGAYSQALRNRGPNADLMSGFVESVQQIDPDMRVQIGGGATVADAFAARYGKPKVKQFMDATGADFRTAGTLLYGSGFNQYDPRDFTAIMSADDPLAAASAGTREALDAGISMLPGKRYRSYRGDDPRYDMIPNSQFGIYNPKDDSPYPIAQQEGVKLDYLGMTPDRITFNAQRFGLDLSNVDALRQAGVPDSTIMALQQSGNVRDFGVYGDQSYLRPNAEYFYNFAGNPVSFFAEGGAADMSEYRDALIASESSGDVGAENPSGAVGLTQAMPDTLEDFKDETGLDFTPEEYANSRELQTQFQDWYEQKTINYIMDKGLDRYIGQTIKGVPITMSSMLGMAHLGGDYGMRKFLETGGRYDPDDGYTKLSDYGRKFANMSIVGQGEVGYRPSPEEILMSMPVKQEAEFTDPRGYSPIPQLRPQYMATDPMPLPRLRPAPETLVEEEVEEALLQRERPTMVQKYGLPGDLPAGIGSLSQMAKNMYS
jgi:hypothetical protein